MSTECDGLRKYIFVYEMTQRMISELYRIKDENRDMYEVADKTLNQLVILSQKIDDELQQKRD